jgi:hypothetical protein
MVLDSKAGPYLYDGEQMANLIISFVMARRPDREKAEILSEKDLHELRHNLAHLSAAAVRDFYDRAYQDCRLVYTRLPSPKQIQTLVQVWKQLWKWR